jgi:uncharacterized membrane protein YhhN
MRWVYAGLAVVDSLLAGSGRPAAHRTRYATKPLLMPTLVASLVTDRAARRSPLRTSTVVAQLAGWGGDLALLRHGTKPFVVGAGSFAVGHAAYITGFRRHGRRRAELVQSTSARTVAAAWLTSGPVLAVAAGRKERALGPAVLGYATILAAMAATATGLRSDVPPAARRSTVAGAGLFLVSDTMLGVRKFVLRTETPRLEFAVMATYTAGQYLLARGAARAGR